MLNNITSIKIKHLEFLSNFQSQFQHCFLVINPYHNYWLFIFYYIYFTDDILFILLFVSLCLYVEWCEILALSNTNLPIRWCTHIICFDFFLNYSIIQKIKWKQHTDVEMEWIACRIWTNEHDGKKLK